MRREWSPKELIGACVSPTGPIGRLRSKQEAQFVELYASRQHTTGELAELFGLARFTVYRAVQCAERSSACG